MISSTTHAQDVPVMVTLVLNLLQQVEVTLSLVNKLSSKFIQSTQVSVHET